MQSNRFVLDEFMKREDLDLNRQDAAGSPAWIYGVEAGRSEEMADALFWNKKLDINSYVHFWETPLIHCVRTGNATLVDALLLRDDLRVNATDLRSESTALAWAVRYGRIDMVHKLLQHPDIQVDVKDGAGDTMLMRAARQGFCDAVLALLAVTPQEVESELAMERAYRRQLVLDRDSQRAKNEEAAKPLPPEGESEGSDIDDGDEDVEWAGGGGDSTTDKRTVTTKRTMTDSLASTDHGVPDLYPKPPASHSEEEGDDDESVTPPPPDPMYYQVMQDPAVVAAIAANEPAWRDSSCALHTRDHWGFTPLAWAAHNGDRDTMLPLLHRLRPVPGAEIRLEVQRPVEVDADGKPVKLFDEPSLEQLDHVSLNSFGKQSHSVASNALLQGPSVESSGFHSMKPRPKLFMQEPLGIVNSHWLYSRTLLNYRTDDGDTPLMWAVKEDQLHIVKALLGVPWIDPEAQDAHGYTALLVALRQRQLPHIEALLRCPHLDTDAPGPDGVTPLMYSVHERYREAITALVNTARCKVNQRDPAG